MSERFLWKYVVRYVYITISIEKSIDQEKDTTDRQIAHGHSVSKPPCDHKKAAKASSIPTRHFRPHG
jgi:hypothetical protein